MNIRSQVQIAFIVTPTRPNYTSMFSSADKVLGASSLHTLGHLPFWFPSQTSRFLFAFFTVLSKTIFLRQVPTPLQSLESDKIGAGAGKLQLSLCTDHHLSCQPAQMGRTVINNVIGIATFHEGFNILQQPPAWWHADKKVLTRD